MTYDKYKPKEDEMQVLIKASVKPLDTGIKKVLYHLLQRSAIQTNQCITNSAAHLSMPRSFVNKKGVCLIVDMRMEIFYSFDVTKQENTYTVLGEYTVCSLGEITQNLCQEDTTGFLLIYCAPAPHLSWESLLDAKRSVMLRFINTKNPYTHDTKDICTEISVFLGQLCKDLVAEIPYPLSQAQTEYLNFLPKSLKALIAFSPLVLELMRHKVEIEVNTHSVLRREILFIFLVALEKDALTEDIILTMMDEMLELVNNIVAGLVTRSGHGNKGYKSYVGNFIFDKEVLVLTQKHPSKKKLKEADGTIRKNQEQISRKTMGSRLTQRKVSTSPSNLKQSLAQLRQSSRDHRVRIQTARSPDTSQGGEDFNSNGPRPKNTLTYLVGN